MAEAARRNRKWKEQGSRVTKFTKLHSGFFCSFAMTTLRGKHYTGAAGRTALFSRISHHSKFNHFFSQSFHPTDFTSPTALPLVSRSQAEASSSHLEASPSGVQDYKMCREQFPPASFIPSPSAFSIYLPMSSNPRKKKTSRRRSESGKCSVEPCPSSSREPCTHQVSLFGFS